jgi:hypothetical protein
MRNASQGASLPPFSFKLIDEEPIVIESSWDEWDEELKKLEAETADGRALALAEID